MRLLQYFCLCRWPNPFHCIVHHQIKKLVVDFSPLCQSAWNHKEYIKVLGMQLLQDMFAIRKIVILIPILLKDPQSILILGIFWTKHTEEALRSIQDVILLIGRDNSWRVALSVPGSVTTASAYRYPSTRHGFFKYPVELFQGMEFLPGCPNINWYWTHNLRRSLPQISFFNTAWGFGLVGIGKIQFLFNNPCPKFHVLRTVLSMTLLAQVLTNKHMKPRFWLPRRSFLANWFFFMCQHRW